MLLCVAAAAQAPQEFRTKYERQVRMLGYDGVGVETIIDNWEAADPEDGDMLVARFNYWLAKSQSAQIVKKDQARFLGEKPTLVLKDSLGVDVNYFQETFYDDEMFGNALTAIDRAASLYPDELKYVYAKLNALLAYEKESPDMTTAAILALIDRNSSLHPDWKFQGNTADQDTFIDGIQEYCFSLFKIKSTGGYEAFRIISEKMAKLYPKNATFQSNLGSYWLVAKSNDKKALACYKKALKLNPADYAAAQNIKIIESRSAQKGRSSK